MKKVDKLLGEGGYGCVFIPEIPCVHDVEYINKRAKGTQVSKIFTYTEESFQKEVEVGKQVQSWDPEGKYFIIPTKACKTTLRLVAKNKDADKCEALRDIKDNKYVNQLVMPYAGTDMFQFLRNNYFLTQKKFPISQWIYLLENIFLGLSVLKKNQITHMDIKADNVIYDGNVLKLFDFGLAKSFQYVYTRTNVRRLSSNYFVYPLEFLLVANKIESCSDCSLYMQYLQTLYTFEPIVRETLYSYHSKKDIIRAVNHIEKWIKHSPDTWIKTVVQQIEKVDIYSVGVMCIDLERFFDFSGISKNKLIAYRKMVKKMTEIDFRRRTSLEKLLQIYTKLQKMK